MQSINSKGVFFSFKHAAIQMVKQGKGGRLIGTHTVSVPTFLASSSHVCQALHLSAASRVSPAALHTQWRSSLSVVSFRALVRCFIINWHSV